MIAKQLWILILALWVGGFSDQAAAQESKVILRFCYYDYEMLPYYKGNNTVVPPLGQRGVIIDIMDQVAEEINLSLDWIRRPWPRCLSMMEQGQVDGLVAVSHTPERAQIMRFPQLENGGLDTARTMSPLAYYFFYNIYNPLEWDGEKFDRARVSMASPRGYVVTKLLREKSYANLQEMGSVEGFKALLGRKIDVYVESMLLFDEAKKKFPNFDLRIKRLEPPIYLSYTFSPVSYSAYQRHPEIIEKLWTEMAPRYEQWRRKDVFFEN